MAEISKEYGTALFILACEKNMKKEYAEALETVEKIFKEEPLYMEFLSSPGIPMNERLSSLESAFSSHIPEDVVSYLQLICERGRIKGFFESVEEYQRLFAESERVLNAKVTSAVELSQDEKERLEKKLGEENKSSVNIEYYVDASLMGGIIVETDGKVHDGSLRTRLRNIKEVIST